MRFGKTCLWLAIVAAPLCSGCWRNRCQPVCNPCCGMQTFGSTYAGNYATQGCSPVYASGYATNSCTPMYTTAQTPLTPIPQTATTTTTSSTTVATAGKKSL